MADASNLLPLLRFHLAVGVRLAMRLFVPAISATVGGGMLLGTDFLISLSNLLFGARSAGGSALFIAAACFGAAAVAAPRICRGVHGWLRHLPISGLAHRRAAGLAIAVSQAPLLILLLVLAAITSRSLSTLMVDALGLAVAALATSLAVTPCERRWLAMPLALAAAILAGSGGWILLFAGGAVLAVAELSAGPIANYGAPRVHLDRRSRGVLLGPRIAWRALGARLFGAYGLGLLPVGAALAFTSNNVLAAGHVRMAARLGAGLAAVLFLSQVAESLAVRRPAWPWVRSLPWSASRRVGADSLLLGVSALPLVALAAWVDPAALLVLACLPLLALRAAGAVRRAPERLTGAAGEVLLEGALLAALVALLPWAAWLALAAVPLALRAATERERQQKVSRWLELHHLAAGDPQSWSAS